MINLRDIQKRVYHNKLEKKFNVKNVDMEFALLYGEVAEAYEAYFKKKPDVGEELADVAIYILGLAEILGVDLEKELLDKIEKNSNRQYEQVDGVLIKTKDE